jgi:hypothetical protein
MDGWSPKSSECSEKRARGWEPKITRDKPYLHPLLVSLSHVIVDGCGKGGESCTSQCCGLGSRYTHNLHH